MSQNEKFIAQVQGNKRFAKPIEMFNHYVTLFEVYNEHLKHDDFPSFRDTIMSKFHFKDKAKQFDQSVEKTMANLETTLRNRYNAMIEHCQKKGLPKDKYRVYENAKGGKRQDWDGLFDYINAQ